MTAVAKIWPIFLPLWPGYRTFQKRPRLFKLHAGGDTYKSTFLWLTLGNDWDDSMKLKIVSKWNSPFLDTETYVIHRSWTLTRGSIIVHEWLKLYNYSDWKLFTCYIERPTDRRITAWFWLMPVLWTQPRRSAVISSPARTVSNCRSSCPPRRQISPLSWPYDTCSNSWCFCCSHVSVPPSMTTTMDFLIAAAI
jgi:hypothetical protein